MISKEEIGKVQLYSNLRVIKKLSIVLIKLCERAGIKYDVLLELLGLKKNDSYDVKYISKSELWDSLSVTEKDILSVWDGLSGEDRRELLFSRLGIKEGIEDDVKKYNQLASYFSGLDFGKLEDCARCIASINQEYSKGIVLGKISKVFLDEYDVDSDSYGELYKEFCGVLSLATGGKLSINELLDTPLELLLELLIRIFIKTEKEIEDSFVLKKIVNLLKRFMSISGIMKEES
jgi:hypothetical protein